MVAKFFIKTRPTLYFIFRIIIGFLFFSHGAAKLFGWFGGNAIASVNLFWFAGLFEILIGLGIFLGVLARLAAIGGVIQMLVALILAHFPKAIHPMMNGGEPAILFLVAFLVIIGYGAGCGSLEKALFGRELI